MEPRSLRSNDGSRSDALGTRSLESGSPGAKAAADAAAEKKNREGLLAEFALALELMKEPLNAFEEKSGKTQPVSPMIMRAPKFGSYPPAGSTPLRSMLAERTNMHTLSAGGQHAVTKKNGYGVELVKDENLKSSSKAVALALQARSPRSKI